VLTLRPTTHDHLERVLAIESAAHTSKWLGETGRAWHERSLADSDQEHLVAEIDGTVVGFGVIAGLRHYDGTVKLRRMAIDPEFRGRGIGRSLLRSMTSRAYAAGAHRVWLDVKPDNERARGLYLSEGFEPTGTATEAYAPTSDLIVLVHAPQVTDHPAISDGSPRHK
jgi:ribosomal protein S18 acetylase RimI-like enzyme